jgi:VWFA-related protein
VLAPYEAVAAETIATTATPRASFTISWPSGPEDGLIDPSAIRVSWTDHPQIVVGIERLATGDDSGESSSPWEVVVYFDAPLLTAEGFRRATDLLARQAPGLVGLGPVSVVLADPTPHTYSTSTTDALLLRQVLEDLEEESVGLGELIWLRDRYLTDRDSSDPSLASIEGLRRETELLRRQRVTLLQWLEPTSTFAPRVVVLVQDGFDLNPRSFYLSQTGDTYLEDPRLEPRNRGLAQTLAAEGWVVVPLSLGSKPAVFSDPLAPLNEMAEITGGTVVRTRRQLGTVVEDLATRYLVTLQWSDLSRAGPGPLEVRDSSTNQTLIAASWLSPVPTPVRQALGSENPLADSIKDARPTRSRSVIELLQPPGLTVSGPTRFQAIAAHRRVARVDFWHDDEWVASVRRAPYSSVIDLGPELEIHTVRAVAFDASGNELGEDRVELNDHQTPPQVFIASLSDDASKRRLEVQAVVEPGHKKPTRIDFYLNDTLSSSISSPPYEARIGYKDLSPQDFVRIVAHYEDGSSAETARMARALTPIDELDVNTIEILATVTSKQRAKLPELDQSDFVVHSDGSPVVIDHFSRSDHLPLAMGLLLDTSDSMNEVIESVGRAAEQFFEQALGPEDVAFVVDFDTRPKLTRAATGDTEDLIRSIRSLQARGNTALYDSIAFSLQQFDADARRKALIVVTDGLDSTSRLLPRRCIEQARHYGVPIYLIVIGSPPTPNDRRQVLFTDAIARQTGGRTFFLTNLDRLDQVYSQISTELRSQYMFAVTTDRTLSPKELEKIKVEVLRKDLSVRAILASQQQGS